MPDTSITSANSVFVITVPGLFPAPISLLGYSTEKAWSTDALELAETQMGVDGRMTAGYTPMPVKQEIVFQADSPSKSIFNSITRATKAARDIYYINGAITLPATGESFTLTRGVLQTTKALPDAGKVLQAMSFTIVWESVDSTLV